MTRKSCARGTSSHSASVPHRLDSPHRATNGELLPEEEFWHNHQKWLEEQGYMLRSRYKPDWTPSWKGTNKKYWQCEDGQSILVPHLLDATRISDGQMVVLKRILTTQHPYEVEISRLFSEEPLASDPRNHCVSILDVLKVEDESDMVILVMPLLRRYDSPRFETVGEALDFFQQIFEGLQFMHQHQVAHRDCMNLNIMMDPKPLYPEMYHPRVIDWSRDMRRPAKHFSRTTHPTRYYFIDFGLSRKYNADEGQPREPPIQGGDKSVPEFQRSSEPCDPFPTDIYYIGNLIREDFLQKLCGVEFMKPLVEDMVADDPTNRPTIDNVLARFRQIHASVGHRKRRSRLADQRESVARQARRNVKHAFIAIGHIIASHPAVPTVLCLPG